MIDITVDNYIRLNPADLPKQALEEIYNKLRIPNPRKKVAEREMLWGAESLPDYIELWDRDVNNNLLLPRGLYHELSNFVSNFTSIYKTVLRRSNFNNIESISLRDYQINSVKQLISHGQGIYKAPTGSGKTRTMLELVRQAGQNTLIICEKKDIQYQWMYAAEKLGFKDLFPVLYCGNGIHILLRQTLWSSRELLDKKWYRQFGMVITDECHHVASADTMVNLIQRFPAYYRFGCSATPDADPDLFPIAQAVLGPIVAETAPEEVGEHLVIPSVRVVKTEFEFPYRPTSVGEKGKVIRNNYCHDEITETLTDKGWMKLDELTLRWKDKSNIFPLVAQFDMKSNKITFGEPEDFYISDYYGDMIKLYANTGLDMLVTPNHKMIVKDRDHNLPWSLIEAHEILSGRRNISPSAAQYDGIYVDKFLIKGISKRKGKIEKSFSKDFEVSMTAWMSWLGWWIAEGVAADGNGVQMAQSLKSTKLNNFKKACRGIGIEGVEHDDGRLWYWRLKGTIYPQVKYWLRDNCGTCSFDKRIPEFAFNLSLEQRMELLRGMMSGDGSPDDWEDHHGFYSTVSKQLADDFQRLATMCGWRATITQGGKTKNGQSYYIGISNHNTRRLPVGDIEVYKGRIYCFTMPNGTMVTRRKGSVAISGNSDMMKDLEEDKNRNMLITSQAGYQARGGYKVLIVSKRKNHLNILMDEWISEWSDFPPNSEIPVYILTGDNSSEYEDIRYKIESCDSGCLLFSTLADEGTDIPCLDRLFLAYPGRKLRGFEQSIGRIMRPHLKKKDAIVYDFRDHKVSLLNSQFRNRCQNIYHKKGYKVDTLV